ncbi:FtsK/SpoIIIE domain-containing protein [Dermatobacter hominis]|uniref:FtsK/SpoIIIE domain-containing protein n=1 Tax=Dermatobacter hominis TaxID=2884263 RepID=UPI001D11F525|nr:FtsK/SpoIIIE domain-containing protein [Dermatobacter hominis]UDY37297.1 hypothetical protein LH044_07095 [Dermatobacter hominis]
MELRYRVVPDDPDGAAHDVRVELADDTPVGELARALAVHCGIAPPSGAPTLRTGTGPRADPGAPAAEGAPRSGSTVRLADDGPGPRRPPWWSPVTLTRVAPERDGDPESVRLPYGTTTLGAARVRIGDDVRVQRSGSLDRVEVDGAPVPGGARAGHGSLLRVGDAVFEVRVDGPLRPPAGRGPWRRHGRVPAVVEAHEPTTVTLPTPPGDDRTPGFPFLSAAVPLLMGAAMWLATGSLAVAGFVLFSVAFVVASGIEVRREHRRDRRFREQRFRDELRRAEAAALELRRAEVARAERALPSGDDAASWATGERDRVWERWPGRPSPGRVRIGTEDAPAADPVAVPSGGRPDLRDELEAAAARLATVRRPAWVDLDEGGLAVVGADGDPAALARSVVLQLACTLGPDHLSLVLDAGPERAPEWRWLWWLPHRVVVSGADVAGDGAGDGGRLVVRVVDRAGGASTADASAGTGTVGTVWVADSAAALPDGIGTVVEVGRDGRARVRRADGPPTDLLAEGLSVEACEPAARALTCLRPPGEEDSVPDAASLQDALADASLIERPAAVAVGWARSRSSGCGLRAPVGVARGGILHLDLVADGPHGLVAGTTGSGKSELLRTLVASMALHHPPDRLTFLLVDYKGGAAFRPLAELPHVVGVVTDLGPAEAARALTSLRAEVRRRERLVATAGATDMTEVAPAHAAPALVVVVDEFATLATELPTLLDGLLDVAQRGRSLGVHLLLATQRPTGVVTDAIRANLSLRLSLRVADREDSHDVLDVDDAAHLPADRPGRAVLRLGPGRLTTVQVATTAAAVDRPERVRCRDLAPDDGSQSVDGSATAAPVDAARTVLDAVVDVCRRAARLDGSPAPRRPWVAPLPDRVDPGGLPGAGRPGGLVVGLVDRPVEQRLAPLELDLDGRGGLLVLGAPRSGRSCALRTIAAAAIADGRCATVVQALDGGRDLGPAEGLVGPGGAVADVVAVGDAERVLRLLRGLLARCRAEDPASQARLLLLVDGAGALVDRHERVNRGEAADLIAAIATEGPAAGVHVVVSAGRPAEVPPTLLAALDRRLVLRCPSPEDAVVLGADVATGLAAVLADPALPPGRGVLDGELVQLALPPSPSRKERGQPGSVGRLPAQVDSTALPPSAGWRLTVGVRADDLGPAHLDLDRGGALVVGPPRSGRTTALRLLASCAHDATGATVVAIDGRRPDGAVDVLRALVDGAAAGAVGGPAGAVVVVVDDLPELLEGPGGQAADELLQRLLLLPSSSGVRVLASAEADAAGRCWSDALRRLRSGRTGVLLRPDPDLHPALLHTALPRHDELPAAPGRGWLVTPDDVVAVQLAR